MIAIERSQICSSWKLVLKYVTDSRKFILLKKDSAASLVDVVVNKALVPAFAANAARVAAIPEKIIRLVATHHHACKSHPMYCSKHL